MVDPTRLLNSPGANEVMSTSTGTPQPKSTHPISISPDEAEDAKLYVWGLQDLAVGPCQIEDTYKDVGYKDGADAELIPDIPPQQFQI